MRLYLLPDDACIFPDVGEAGPDGLLAIGGDLTPERLLRAYEEGIFPWYGPGDPILWWSPDPRCVLPLDALHVPRRLMRTVRAKTFEVRLDTAFANVLEQCAATPRPGQGGTWLVPEMRAAYTRLHHLGHAHSVEAWYGGRLVGGLYGVALGGGFFGESMFHAMPDASKVAFVWLARLLVSWGFRFVDCQQTTSHMLRFGAVEMPRTDFLACLHDATRQPSRIGRWRLPQDFVPW